MFKGVNSVIRTYSSSCTCKALIADSGCLDRGLKHELTSANNGNPIAHMGDFDG